MLQVQGVHEEPRRHAERHQVGERVQLDTHRAGHAQQPGNPPVKAIQQAGEQDGPRRQLELRM
jgi:hypothetical protein